MRNHPSHATFSAGRQFRISPTVTFAPARSRNVSDTSARCHDSLARCVVTAFTELDKIMASRKPSCSAMRRIRSSNEMPHRSVNACGESATINNGGRKASVILGVAAVFRQFVSSQTTWRKPSVAQAMARCNRDEFRTHLEGNAIIIDRHYPCISAASRQLFLNSLKSSVIMAKAKQVCRIHDARPAIVKKRNTK